MSEAFSSDQEQTPNGLEMYGAPQESENFPGAQIITVKEGDIYTRYAVSRDSDGVLSGVTFELKEKTFINGQPFFDNSSAVIQVLERDPERFKVGDVIQRIDADKIQELQAMIEAKGLRI